MTSKTVAVIGAGIVGAAAAIWLRRAGFDVVLVDRQAPGEGASFGNAGVLASCSVVPVTTPGLVANGLKYLADPNFPLYMRWRYLPKLMPWLLRYLGHANSGDARRISHGLATIVGDSLEQHQALTEGTPAAKWIRPSNYGFVYRSRAAFEADAFTWQLRKEAGFVPEIIEGEAVREHEPSLASDMRFLALMQHHGFILNPGRYVKDLVAVFEGLEGRFVQAEVKDFDLSGGSVRALETSAGRIECSKTVLSAGVWSRAMMNKLGLSVPLEAERGYHILFRNPSVQPSCPLMLAAGKFVATPMENGLRCAGIVEFGGLSDKKSKAPLALLRRKVKAVFPELEADSEEEWLGFRPAPTDSLPLIGEIGGTGVYSAFGHHHIGLTGGPKTGRLISDMIAGVPTNYDMSAFEPKRFEKRA